ncbi:septum formation family protein [Nocardioides sp.]|uniref:septum formation family protein n=1 Tax=Nocardioides sp. TaxID=35761 RepID=UPI003D109233
MPHLTRAARASVGPVLALLLLAGCTPDDQGTNIDPAQVDAVRAPDNGACRRLSPADVAMPSNATVTVDCTDKHSAETYAVGTLPAEFDKAAYDDKAVGRYAYQTCSSAFEEFLGADESLAMRTIVSWVWFRPSEPAWEKGARWYRCDVIGGGAQTKKYVDLPTTARGLLQKRPDTWMACVNGPSVNGLKTSCDRPHTWRAVTTIKLGQAADPYPGDRAVEARTEDFCSDSVGAWLNYPVDYDFGFTWFKEGEWSAGNRRSICWARTDQ